MPTSGAENTSEFARLYVAAVERIAARGHGTLTRLAREWGISRQKFYGPKFQKRYLSDEAAMRVAKEAGLDEDETAALMNAWLRERLEGGKLGEAYSAICAGLDAMPEIVSSALEDAPRETRERAIIAVKKSVARSYRAAFDAYSRNSDIG